MNYQTAEGWLKYICSTPIEIEDLEARVEECRQAIDRAEQKQQWKFVLDLSSKLANKFLNSGFHTQGSEELNLEQGLSELKTLFRCGKEIAMCGLQASRKFEDAYKERELLNALIRLSVYSDDSDTALSVMEQRLSLVASIEEKWGVAYDIFKMGQTARQFGYNSASQDYFKMSLKIHQELGNQSEIATCFVFLGQVQLVMGEVDQAKHSFNQSLKFSQQTNHFNVIMSSLYELGQIARQEGDIEQAKGAFNKALLIAAEIKVENTLTESLSKALASLENIDTSQE